MGKCKWRYDVMFQFDSRTPAGLKEVTAETIAEALSKAHEQLLDLDKIADYGDVKGKLPRSVTVTRVSHPARKKKVRLQAPKI